MPASTYVNMRELAEPQFRVFPSAANGYLAPEKQALPSRSRPSPTPFCLSDKAQPSRRPYFWLNAFDTIRDVMSTISIIRSYAMRVGPITPSVPTTCPLIS